MSSMRNLDSTAVIAQVGRYHVHCHPPKNGVHIRLTTDTTHTSTFKTQTTLIFKCDLSWITHIWWKEYCLTHQQPITLISRPGHTRTRFDWLAFVLAYDLIGWRFRRILKSWTFLNFWSDQEADRRDGTTMQFSVEATHAQSACRPRLSLSQTNKHTFISVMI